jgi:hypothetical protein
MADFKFDLVFIDICMSFKLWLENISMFDLRDKTQRTNVGKMLGFSKPLVKFSQGSIATIYKYPKNNELLIKVTSHSDDVKNIIKAQRLNSDNVVKAFSWEDGRMIKSLPSLDSQAIIVEKIDGTPMDYTSSEFFILSLNGKFDLAADWLDSTVHEKQKKVLDFHGKNDNFEHSKLSDLFRALAKLEKFYGIELSDFQDNILDAGNRYVIVDMGY